MIASEFTAFTFDRTERFSCNAVQEAFDSPVQTMSDFDVIIIGDSVSDASY